MSNNEGMTLTEFLEARIAEDEDIAQKAAASSTPAMDVSNEPVGPAWEDGEGMVLGQPDKDGYAIPLWDNEGSSTLSMHPNVSAHVACHDPARVLADCAAKRALLDIDFQTSELLDNHRVMASVHKEHPDYRQEWSV